MVAGLGHVPEIAERDSRPRSQRELGALRMSHARGRKHANEDHRNPCCYPPHTFSLVPVRRWSRDDASRSPAEGVAAKYLHPAHRV